MQHLSSSLCSPKINDFYCETLQNSSSPSGTLTSSSASGMCTYPLANYVSSHQFSPIYTAFLAAINDHTEPSRLSKALTHPHWKIAIDALERNHTWTLTSLPSGKKSLGCKWIFKIKLKSDEVSNSTRLV